VRVVTSLSFARLSTTKIEKWDFDNDIICRLRYVLAQFAFSDLSLGVKIINGKTFLLPYVKVFLFI